MTLQTPVPYDEQYLRFLAAEESATGRLKSFYAQTRVEFDAFLAEPPLPLTQSEQAFFTSLQREVDRLATNADQVAATWLTQSVPMAFVEGALQHSPMLVFTAVHDNAVRALSGYTLDLITRMNADMRRVVQQQIAVGMLEGATRRQISDRLLRSGLTNIPHWRSVEERAAVIARTEMMRAYNAGNLYGIADTGAVAVRWITGRDEFVCGICGPRHGHVYRLPHAESDDPDVRKLDDVPGQPPAHPRCRCTVRAQYEIDGRTIGSKTIPEPTAGGVIAQTPTPDAVPSAATALQKRRDSHA
jgi:SPP1 gp7 family putative phage head morphogenesis protein